MATHNSGARASWWGAVVMKRPSLAIDYRVKNAGQTVSKGEGAR